MTTTTTTHTPGPWLVFDDLPGGFDIICPDQTGTVAHVAARRPGEEEIERANAALIAAAPDLLAALKDLWGYVQDLQNSNPGYLGKLALQDYARLNRALGDAPAAIAKAEGRS